MLRLHVELYRLPGRRARDETLSASTKGYQRDSRVNEQIGDPYAFDFMLAK